jgi:hypothetical protein
MLNGGPISWKSVNQKSVSLNTAESEWYTASETGKDLLYVCVFITVGPSTKMCAWGGGDIGGHVLRETTSRGLCGLVCPSRTSERGGEGDCVKEGEGGEGKCERERALGLLICHSPGH